jgi:hypothetical protein
VSEPLNPSILTPTEDLMMEVLAARHRLGESLWTFDSRTRRLAVHLEKMGFIVLIHGNVENTFRARMTTQAADVYLSKRYKPPILKRYTLKKRYKKKKGKK